MAQSQIAIAPFTGRFGAMNCPCEILVDTQSQTLGAELLAIAREEAERIESRYSRYRPGNIVHAMNTSQGETVRVDEETAALLDYSAQCYLMSEGLFDVTVGSLRHPSASRIGWDQVRWKRPDLQMPAGFEIDFGGICKEYAADRILKLLRERTSVSLLVNLGGDIAAYGQRSWTVGLEDATKAGEVARTVTLREGGVATSGTTKRPGHLLNPQTAQPVTNTPLSVTVAAATCTEAGFWSTLAMLHGAEAESFLERQSLSYWCFR